MILKLRSNRHPHPNLPPVRGREPTPLSLEGEGWGEGGNHQNSGLWFLCLLTLATIFFTACTNEAQLMREGNEAFANGAYDEAAQAYNEAQQAAPELAEPVYNQANTRYRQEGLAEAEQLLQQALETADADLAQSAYYNLGNVHFNNQNWQAAIEAYQESLRLNPADADARHNLELAMQQLQQQEEEQQQQQEEEQPQEDQSEENQGEQQQEEQNDSEEQQEQVRTRAQQIMDRRQRVPMMRVMSHQHLPVIRVLPAPGARENVFWR